MSSIVRRLALLLALLALGFGSAGIADAAAGGFGSRLGPAAPAPGDLDTTFGGDGTVTTTLGPYGAVANAVAIQADGKIVAVGQSLGSDPDFALARYNSGGTLDTAFGTGGKVTTDFAGAGDVANAVAIQADGKIIAAGVSGGDFALARYNADGTLDTTFDVDGKVTTDFAGAEDVASAVAVQADGKIVAAGTGSRPELARYDPAGTLDPTFGTDGKVVTSFSCCPSFVGTSAVALQADAKIVSAGLFIDCYPGGCDRSFLLVRYNTDGTLDATFGGGGVVVDIAGVANAVAIQADGKIVAAGQEDGPKGGFELVRYDADGTRDDSFGDHGWVFTDITRGTDSAQGVAIQADGKIVVAGAGGAFGPHPKFALARYIAG